MKQFAGEIIILHMCSKNHNHMVHGSWDTEWDRQNFLTFWAIFCPFTTPPASPPNDSKKSKFWSKIKSMSGDIILLSIHVCHKWTSYDIWFLKCKVWLTEIFVILCHFLLVQPPDNLEYQNSKIEKSTWRYYHFTHLHHKWQSYDVWFLRYEVWRTEFFVNLCRFLPFYLTNNIKNQNSEKLKKHLEILSFYKCAP